MNIKLQRTPFFLAAVFFIAGITVEYYTCGTISTLVWMAFLCLSILTSILVYTNRILMSLFILVACGMLGGLLMSRKTASMNVSLPNGKRHFSAVIIDNPKQTDSIVRCDIVVSVDGKPLKVFATLAVESSKAVPQVGDGLQFTSTLKAPQNKKGSGFDFKTYLYNNGFTATAYIGKHEWKTGKADMNAVSIVQRVKIAALQLREKLLLKYRSLHIDDQEYAVLAAMTLGYKTAMTQKTRQDYAVSGVGHILALSGLHLSIIYVLLTFMLGEYKEYYTTQVIVNLAIWTFVFLVGMSVSVTRAAITISACSVTFMMVIRSVSLNTVSIAAMLVLAFNPMVVFDVGYQMSFIAVVSIVLFYKPLYNLLPFRLRFNKPLKWIWSTVSVATAAKIGVFPIIAFYFGRISCYTFLTDIIVVPIVTLILYGTVLMLVLSFVPPLQTAVAYLLGRVVWLLNHVVSFFASLPGVSIEGVKLTLTQLVCVYALLICAYLISVYVYRLTHQYPKTPPYKEYIPEES